MVPGISHSSGISIDWKDLWMISADTRKNPIAQGKLKAYDKVIVVTIGKQVSAGTDVSDALPDCQETCLMMIPMVVAVLSTQARHHSMSTKYTGGESDESSRPM